METSTAARIATMDAAVVIQLTLGGDMPRDERGWGEDSGGSGRGNNKDNNKNKVLSSEDCVTSVVGGYGVP